MRLSDFKVLSFDCYGTLIYWETGLLQALQPLAKKVGRALTSDQILEAFARHEAAQQATHPSLIYSKLLGEVLGLMAQEWGMQTTEEEKANFSASIKTGPHSQIRLQPFNTSNAILNS